MSWLEDVDQEHQTFLATSPKGWTSNELSMDWLIHVFNKFTYKKAR